MRPGGIAAALRSISRQCAPIASPLLTAIKMQNSGALALRLYRARSAAMNAGICSWVVLDGA
jgi:hypothetical protein